MTAICPTCRCSASVVADGLWLRCDCGASWIPDPPAPQPRPRLSPFCGRCGWRKGGLDSWDGRSCRCGLSEPPMPEVSP